MAPSRRPARPRRARLTVQTLEARDVPAGTVKATLVNGLLTLTGDDNSNAVSIIVTGAGAGGGPRVKLVAADNTGIDGNIPADGDVTSIRAVMNGGNDSLIFGSEVDLDKDPNAAVDFILPGGAAIDLGDGDNTFTADLLGKLSLGDLSVTAGDGKDTVLISAREASSGMATGRKSMKPVSISVGDGGYDVTVKNFTVPGKAGMTFTAGDGDGTFAAAGIDTSGDGQPDTVGLQLGDMTAGNLTNGGAFTGTTGNGICSYSWGVSQTGSYSHAGGGGSGRVSATFADSSATGDVTLTGAASLDLTATNTAVGGSVKVQKKWLPANFRASATVSLTNVQVTRGVDVSADGGSSAASLALTDGRVGGSVKVTDTGTNGNAALTAVRPDVSGAVEVKATGPGGLAVGDWNGDGFVGPVTVQGRKQASMSVAGSLTVAAFGGMMNGKPGDVSVTSAGGDASLSLTGPGSPRDPAAPPTLQAGDVSVGGFATARVSLGSAADLDLDGDLAVTSTQDASVADLNRDGILDVAGKVTVTGQDDAGITNVADWSSGPVAVASRYGGAQFALTGSVALKNGLTVNGGNSVDVTLTPPVGAGGAPLVDGKVLVSGGFGGGKVVFQDLHFSSVKVDVKGGGTQVTMKDAFVIPHVLEKSGSLSISTGSGNDAVTLDGVTVAGKTDIRTGGGKDTLTVNGSAQDQGHPYTFGDTFTADLGAGDDQILLAQDAAAKFPVTFAKGVTIEAGAGNDTLKVGVAGGTPGVGPNTSVAFKGTPIKIRGGAGLNTFDPRAGDFTLPQGVDPKTVFLGWTPGP